MASITPFNSADVEPSKSFDALPAAKYLLIITESDVKATKSGTGSYLAITCEVLDGDFKGRKLWGNFNTSNPNKEAEQIAKAELSALCRAVGVVVLTDTTQLHGVPFVGDVKIDKKDTTRNVIKGFAAAGPAGAAHQFAPNPAQGAPTPPLSAYQQSTSPLPMSAPVPSNVPAWKR